MVNLSVFSKPENIYVAATKPVDIYGHDSWMWH
jgi:hypothetical protein